MPALNGAKRVGPPRPGLNCVALNRVQFQKGYSLVQFMDDYGTEEKCTQALFRWRWPNGFVCPRCEHTRHWRHQSRAPYRCRRCRHQVSLTAGTILASTKLALRIWFLAMYLMTQTKNGISTLELSRQLAVSYNTAWKVKHKLIKHLPRYLAEFSYRFNRRFSLSEMFSRLAFVALRTAPMPYRVLKLAENYP